MVEDLDELVDLLELARHRRHQLALGRGHAERGEEGRVKPHQALLLAVVRLRRQGLPLVRLPVQARLALLAETQLEILARGQQMGMAERSADERV